MTQAIETYGVEMSQVNMIFIGWPIMEGQTDVAQESNPVV